MLKLKNFCWTRISITFLFLVILCHSRIQIVSHFRSELQAIFFHFFSTSCSFVRQTIKFFSLYLTSGHFRSELQAIFFLISFRLHVLSSDKWSSSFHYTWHPVIFAPNSKPFFFHFFSTSCCFVRLSVI
jgi:hypothetical protein